ncbi:hypothetical protein [Ruminococcus sp.]|uniref:hypothetical protein n=1 Tax=Ruminococcus sp. TaxID=41978 RepID=UPI0025E0DF7F|nr:hypothetical protein [Ruminococcus sp.]MBD9050978.1 hypothetical protein [Ruminococcus sp.]
MIRSLKKYIVLLKNTIDVITLGCSKNLVDSEKLTTLFRSVVVFGKAEIMENEEKINSAMLSFGLKYNNDINAVKKEIERERSGLCCVEITIEHITGKQAIELVKSKTIL